MITNPALDVAEWQKDAACYEIPNFLRDARDGGEWCDSDRLTLCRGTEDGTVPKCPVRNLCLEYALLVNPLMDLDHKGIVYGGLTGKELADLWRRREKHRREQSSARPKLHL